MQTEFVSHFDYYAPIQDIFFLQDYIICCDYTPIYGKQ